MGVLRGADLFCWVHEGVCAWHGSARAAAIQNGPGVPTKSSDEDQSKPSAAANATHADAPGVNAELERRVCASRFRTASEVVASWRYGHVADHRRTSTPDEVGCAQSRGRARSSEALLSRALSSPSVPPRARGEASARGTLADSETYEGARAGQSVSNPPGPRRLFAMCRLAAYIASQRRPTPPGWNPQDILSGEADSDARPTKEAAEPRQELCIASHDEVNAD